MSASLTEMTGNFSTFFSAMLRRRMTPVVVSSVPPMTFLQQIFPLGMEMRDDVGAVVHREMGAMGDGRFDVAIVGRVVLAFDGEGRNAFMLNEGCGDVILRAERIGGAEPDIGSAGFQRDRQIGGFRGDVEAGGHSHALERLLPLEAFRISRSTGMVASAHSILSLPWSASLMSFTS